MGVGKTTLSNALSSLSQAPASDTDVDVSRLLKASISIIFQNLGEDQFRRWEFEVAVGFTQHQIVASGGGTVLYCQLRFRLRRCFVLGLGYKSPNLKACPGSGASRPLQHEARALCKDRTLAYKSSMKHYTGSYKRTLVQSINCTTSLLDAFYGK